MNGIIIPDSPVWDHIWTNKSMNTENSKRRYLKDERLWSYHDIIKVKKVRERLSKLWRQRNTK